MFQSSEAREERRIVSGLLRRENLMTLREASFLHFIQALFVIPVITHQHTSWSIERVLDSSNDVYVKSSKKVTCSVIQSKTLGIIFRIN